LSDARWQNLEHQDPSFRRYWAYTADGGYLAMAAGEDDFGHGYDVVSNVDSAGVPVGFASGPINEGDRPPFHRALQDYGDLLQLFDDPDNPDAVRVLGADAGFTGFEQREAIRTLGMLENIHPVSGSREGRAIEHEERLTSKRIAIVPKDVSRPDNWLTDGHRNLLCRCGQGEVKKKFYRSRKGKLIPRLEGHCPTCGRITITSGDWALHNRRWRHRLKHPSAQVDPQMGNPLTFTNPISERYAKRRFAVQEGMHSVLSNRFHLIDGRKRVKTSAEVDLLTLMTYCAIHGIAHARAQAQAPPAQSLPLAA
jgi:ribosomal protein S27AE